MTVTWAREIWDGREGDTDKEGVRNYTRIFRVKTDNKWDDAVTVLNSGTLPAVGDPHPNDLESWCIAVRPRNEGASPFFWTATCNYSSDKELSDNPLDDDADITWTTQKYQEPVVEDIDGNAVVNSAGDQFDPQVMRDNSRRVVTIKKNLAVVPAYILSYEDTINDAEINIDGITIPAGKAKCDDISVDAKAERNDIDYYPVTIRIHLREDGWVKKILDVGFNEIEGSNGRQKILLDDGSEPTGPVPLDGNGSRLDNPTTETCVVLEFNIYPEVDFSALPLS